MSDLFETTDERKNLAAVVWVSGIAVAAVIMLLVPTPVQQEAWFAWPFIGGAAVGTGWAALVTIVLPDPDP